MSPLSLRGFSMAMCAVVLAVARSAHADPRSDPASPGPFSAYFADQFTDDDNLYRLPVGYNTDVAGLSVSRQDHINTVAAGASGQWTLARQTLNASVQIENNRFSQNGYLNNTAGVGRLLWGWRAGSILTGEAGADFSRSLTGFAHTFFFGKDLVDTREYFVSGALQVASHWNINGGVREADTAHSAAIRRSDDLHGKSANLGIQYLPSEEDSFGLEYRHTDANLLHEVVFDGRPSNRSYQDDLERILVKYQATAKTFVDVTAGYITRRYPNPQAGSFSGSVWRASVQWRALEKTQIAVTGWRELTAYFDAESDYFVSQGASIAPTWSPTGKIALAVVASWSDQSYLSSSPSTIAAASRHDRIRAEHAELTYVPRDALTLRLAYRNEWRDSNRGQFAYDDRIASVGFKITY